MNHYLLALLPVQLGFTTVALPHPTSVTVSHVILCGGEARSRISVSLAQPTATLYILPSSVLVHWFLLQDV